MEDFKPLAALGEKRKASSLLSIPFLAATIIMITYLIVPQRGWWFDQREVINSFFINGAFFFVMLVKCAVQKPYSLELMHWIFCYFFFYFAATIQFRIYYFPWDLEPSNDEILQANRYLLTWGISFWLGTSFAKYVKGFQGRTAVGFKGEALKDFAIIAAIATVYMMVIGGTALLNRGKTHLAFAENMDQTSWLVILNGIRAFITFNVIFNLIYYRKEKKGQLYLLFSILCLLICCFPTGMARFQMATIYLGIMIFYFPQLRRGTKFTYFFIFALIILFPFLDNFRYQDFFRVNIIQAFKTVFQDMAYSYTEGHYDAFSMMIYTMKLVGEKGIYWGKQLLGGLFFFVPRSIWKGKPYSTGHMIMTKLGASFTNVSEPLTAEMYTDFGLVGMAILAIFIGWIVKKIDMAYWQKEETEDIHGLENREWSYLSILYPVLLSLFFFVLRGAFMSTFSGMMAFVVVGYIMFRYCGDFKKD